MIRADIAVNKTYKEVGICIYCGATENLHGEHCIPESLNGMRILEKGSCGDCGRITSKFEGDYARNSMLPARTAMNMKSKRSKSKRPTEFPIRIVTNDKEETINVPLDDYYPVIPSWKLDHRDGTQINPTHLVWLTVSTGSPWCPFENRNTFNT